MKMDEPKNKLDPTKLTLEQCAQTLSQEIEHLQEDIDAGFPLNEDGTMNVLSYGAWLLSQGDA